MPENTLAQKSPQPPTIIPEVKRFEDVTDFKGLYTLLDGIEVVDYDNSRISGQMASHKIMEVTGDTKGLQDKGKFIKYIGFIAKFSDPAVRRVLNRLLIANDPALSEIQKIEDEKKRRQEKENFSIEEVVAQHVKNLEGMGEAKRGRYIDNTLKDAIGLEEKHKGYLEALQEKLLKAGFLKAVSAETNETSTEQPTITPPDTEVTKEIPLSPEVLETQRRLGEIFMEFKKASKSEFPLKRMEAMVKEKFRDAVCTEIYRWAAADDIYFTDKKDANPAPYFCIKVGGKNYLVPKILNLKRFDDSNRPKGFKLESIRKNGEVIPETLEQCLPAILKGGSSRWEIELEGLLSDIKKTQEKKTEDEMVPGSEEEKETETIAKLEEIMRRNDEIIDQARRELSELEERIAKRKKESRD